MTYEEREARRIAQNVKRVQNEITRLQDILYQLRKKADALGDNWYIYFDELGRK